MTNLRTDVLSAASALPLKRSLHTDFLLVFKQFLNISFLFHQAQRSLLTYYNVHMLKKAECFVEPFQVVRQVVVDNAANIVFFHVLHKSKVDKGFTFTSRAGICSTWQKRYHVLWPPIRLLDVCADQSEDSYINGGPAEIVFSRLNVKSLFLQTRAAGRSVHIKLRRGSEEKYSSLWLLPTVCYSPVNAKANFEV